jgi:hypothetical protein
MELSVYNSSTDKLTLTSNQVLKMAIELSEELPLNGVMWKPNAFFTACQVWYHLNVIFLHLIPGLVMDGFFKLCGRKPQ